MVPAKTDRQYERYKKYHALDKDGLARVGEQLSEFDIFVNKCVPRDPALRLTHASTSRFAHVEPVDPNSVEMKQEPVSFRGLANPVYVDRMIITSNNEESRLIKLIARQTRIPEIGDKFSSRHG